MMKPAYSLGRFLQIVALLAMPFSIWVGHIGHNEHGAIIIFIGSIIIFLAGWLLTRFR